MHVTSLLIEAPDRLAVTRLLRDDPAAYDLLRELFPDRSENILDEDLVHHLAQDGVRVRLERHDLSQVLGPQVLPSSPYGDLHRISSYMPGGEPRRGQFMRPATPLEAAMSRSCARFDGGLGVFGVQARHTTVLADDGEPEAVHDPAAVDYLHYGSDAWQTALLHAFARYYRVENIPAGAILPDLAEGRFIP